MAKISKFKEEKIKVGDTDTCEYCGEKIILEYEEFVTQYAPGASDDDHYVWKHEETKRNLCESRKTGAYPKKKITLEEVVE
jgi:hypothetical protein